MLSALEDEDSEVELIHLPVMDEYHYPDAKLYDANDIKKKIDADKKFKAFIETQCNIAEVNEFIEQFGTEVYDMSDYELKLKMGNHICVKWSNPLNNKGDVEYFVPENNILYDEQEEKVFNYLKKSFQV